MVLRGIDFLLKIIYWWIQSPKLCGDKLLEYRYVQVWIIAKRKSRALESSNVQQT